MTEAKDGKRSFGYAKQQGFDAVIFDVNMPVMDGINFIRELRSLPNYKFNTFTDADYRVVSIKKSGKLLVQLVDC